jgi:enoyl-CoA hydratase
MFNFLRVSTSNGIAELVLDNASKANAMGLGFWSELPQALEWLDKQTDVRVIILKGEGRHFSAGADMELLEHLFSFAGGDDLALGCESLRAEILKLQSAFNRLEDARVPVVAAVHGACIGAGLDMIAACDLRLCSADARFCLKEVDFGIVADVGSGQRLRHIIGFSRLSEIMYTGEAFDAGEAKAMGLVSKVLDDKDALYAEADRLASLIASKSALTIRGVKRNLLFSRDNSVRDGLEYVATWNAFALLNSDCGTALADSKKRE